MVGASRSQTPPTRDSAALSELTRVVLLADRTDRNGKRVSAGTSGTIVAVLGGGEAYIVEFVNPIEALLTVEAGAVQSATRSRMST